MIFSLEAKRFILNFRSWPPFIQADKPFRGLLWTALALSWKRSEVWKPRSHMGWQERKTIDHSWTARDFCPSRIDTHLSVESNRFASSPKKASGSSWRWRWHCPKVLLRMCCATECLSVPVGPKAVLRLGRQGYPEGIGRSRPNAEPPVVGNSETRCPKLVSFVSLTKSKAVKSSLLAFLAGHHPKRKCWDYFSAIAFSTT